MVDVVAPKKKAIPLPPWCKHCKIIYPKSAYAETGWSKRWCCLPCLHKLRMAGSPNYRAQVAKEGTPWLDEWVVKYGKKAVA